jgi:hypothetical protein
MAKISSFQRHSRHLLAAVGQLDFSHLLTEPKDSSTITTFERNKDGWIVALSPVGHWRYLKFNGVLLLIRKIIKEFIKEFIGVLLSRSGVLLSCWSYSLSGIFNNI